MPDAQENTPNRLSIETEKRLPLPGFYAAVNSAGLKNDVVRIFEQGDRLKIELEDDTLDLIQRDDGRYYPQYKLFGLFPIGLDGFEEMGISRAKIYGRDVLLVHMAGDDHLFAERIPSAPIPTAWQRRLGEYQVVNPEGDRSALSGVRLYEKEGLLLMAYRYNLLFEAIYDDDDEPTIKALVPLSDREVAIHGLGRNNGEVLRIESLGDQELLYFSGYLLRSH